MMATLNHSQNLAEWNAFKLSQYKLQETTEYLSSTIIWESTSFNYSTGKINFDGTGVKHLHLRIITLRQFSYTDWILNLNPGTKNLPNPTQNINRTYITRNRTLL